MQRSYVLSILGSLFLSILGSYTRNFAHKSATLHIRLCILAFVQFCAGKSPKMLREHLQHLSTVEIVRKGHKPGARAERAPSRPRRQNYISWYWLGVQTVTRSPSRPISPLMYFSSHLSIIGSPMTTLHVLCPKPVSKPLQSLPRRCTYTCGTARVSQSTSAPSKHEGVLPVRATDSNCPAFAHSWP